MDIMKFSTVGYFIECYLAWPELEESMGSFFVWEKKNIVKAFREEVKTLYLLNDSELIRAVFHKFGNMELSGEEALNRVAQLYEKSQEDINRFSTVGFFIEHYFNWSKDWSALEECLEEFLHRENQERAEAFRKEVEILYKLDDQKLIQSVSCKLGGRGMAPEKASDMIELLYAKTQKNVKEFGIFKYFFSIYMKWPRDWSDVEECMDEFMKREGRERIEAFRKGIAILYKSNDPALAREVFRQFGGRRIPPEKAKSMIELLYTKAR